MERDPQKVGAVLSDPTRYHIYQHVLTVSKAVSVADVAEKFGLHPNVARMHLGKLVDIGLLGASTAKTGKGGRPGYVYFPSGNAVSLTVPARDFQLLADLLVQSLALMGDGAKGAIDQIGQAFGRRLGNEALEMVTARQGENSMSTREELFRTCATALRRLGVHTQMSQNSDGSISLTMKNCGFEEVATAHPEHVCHLCKAMVEGITQATSDGQPDVTQAASRPKGDRDCVWSMHGMVRLQ